MTNKRLLKYIIIQLLCTAIFLTGCDKDPNIQGSEPDKEPEMISSDVVSIPIEKVRTFNPLLSNDEDAYYVNKLIYQGLFTFDEGLSAKGVLAESYNYDDKGNLLITLVKDAVWQDGEGFTSKDVKFSIDAYNSVPIANRGVHAAESSLIKSVRVIDTYSVQLQFADLNRAAIENLTFPILPAHKYKNAGDLIASVGNFKPMGTGPYSVSLWEEGKEMVLSGNPNYKGAIPKNTLIFKYMPQKENALNLFSIKEINLTYLREIDRDTLIENKDVEIIPFTSSEVEVIGFNFNHGALQDPIVRRAIAHAIDNRTILENCYFNSGILSDNIYYPGYLGVENSEDAYPFDTAEASALLKSTGNEGLSLNIIFNGDNHSRNLAAQLIKNGLEKIGISVSLSSLTKEEYEKSLDKGDFDLYIGGFRFNGIYDTRPVLQTNGVLNKARYSNPQLDEYLDQMQSGINREEKKAVFEHISKIYTQEIPYYCLLYKTYGLAVSKDLEGSINPYFHNVYNECEDWKLVYEKPTE